MIDSNLDNHSCTDRNPETSSFNSTDYPKEQEEFIKTTNLSFKT